VRFVLGATKPVPPASGAVERVVAVGVLPADVVGVEVGAGVTTAGAGAPYALPPPAPPPEQAVIESAPAMAAQQSESERMRAV
jgi:hypothetical protein